MKKDEENELKSGEKSGENVNNKPISESTRIRFAEKTAKKEGVAKGVWTTAIISFILLVAVGIFGITRYNSEQKQQLAVIENQKQAFTMLLTTRDSLINESRRTFDEIERKLNTIREKETIIKMKTSGKELSKERKQQSQQDIGNINTLRDKTKRTRA